jgi:hypothetical protein
VWISYKWLCEDVLDINRVILRILVVLFTPRRDK